MSIGTIGVEVSGRNATEVVGQIKRLEELGVKAAWATSGGDADPITLLAVAAVQTESILLGTSIVPHLAPPPDYRRPAGQPHRQSSSRSIPPRHRAQSSL